MAYDKDNVFARMLRGEIPCDKVYEDAHVLAFRDIRPQARQHVLVVPKRAYVSTDDFAERAPDAEIAALFRAVGRIARELELAETGYRVIVNHGPDSRQEVPHLHVHILGGQDLGRLVCPPGS